MKAVRIETFGGPEVLQLQEVPDPIPGPDDVLLRVGACGVCGHDVLTRSGALPGPQPPIILGHELAGTVAAVGERVTNVEVGARVAVRQHRSCHHCHFCRTGRETICPTHTEYGQDLPGGYAELCVVDPVGLVPIADSIDWPEAAIAACAIGTVIHALRLAAFRFGERVLVTGASGGLGIHAMQVARAGGGEVIAVTSSQSKVAQLEPYADHVVVLDNGDFQTEVRRRGIQPDVILDLTAGVTLDQSARSVARAGRIIIVGNVDPRPVPILPGAWINREIAVAGSNSATLEDLQTAISLIERKAIKPLVGEVFPLARAAEAHRAMEARAAVGRLVLVP